MEVRCSLLGSRAATEAGAIAAHTGLHCVGVESGTPAFLTPIASFFIFLEFWVRLLHGPWLMVDRFPAGHLHQGGRRVCEFLPEPVTSSSSSPWFWNVLLVPMYSYSPSLMPIFISPQPGELASGSNLGNSFADH